MTAAAIDRTHDPALESWVEGAGNHAAFPVQNLPYGIFRPADDAAPRAGVAIGDHILDLRAAAALLPDVAAAVVSDPVLNRLLALPAADRAALRRRLSDLLSDAAHRGAVAPLIHPAGACTLGLPCAIGDYTDFYTGIHHAEAVGRQFRPDAPLLPNYKWLPIGYHGRASSVRPSGEPVVRPNGQRRAPDAAAPVFGPSERLDYELELGVWIGRGNALGTPIPIGRATAHVAGFCLLNDWSARDLQVWEYQPLGPFLAKSFHTTVSPWVVTAEAMAPFRIAQPGRPDGDPRPLRHLWDADDQRDGAFSIALEVRLRTRAMRDAGILAETLGRAAASDMYWTVAQMVAHHASNGCGLRPGDLLGTGTISAGTEDGRGSLIERTRGGTRPVDLPTGETRFFLEDGDEVSLHATAHAPGFRPIGFGDCRAVVAAAPALDAMAGPSCHG